jgi:exosortase/archaeosortase family protein
MPPVKSSNLFNQGKSLLVKTVDFLKLKNLDGITQYIILLIVSYITWKVGIENSKVNVLLEPLYSFLIRADIFLTRYIIGFLNINVSSQGSVILIPGRNGILVTPLCSGLQHIFEITFILILYKKFQFEKLWYIPLSILVTYFAAVIHLVVLCFYMVYKPDSVIWAHNHLSRWIFFIFFFCIWLTWEEIIRKKTT